MQRFFFGLVYSTVCPDRHKNNKIRVATANTNYRGWLDPPKKQVRFRSYKQESKQDLDNDKTDQSQVCGACIIPTDTVSYVQAESKNAKTHSQLIH